MFFRMLVLLMAIVGCLALREAPADVPQQQQQQVPNQVPRGGGEPVTVKPEPFQADGRKGWKVRLAGAHPLATPAVARGRVFIGGGFGSHEFYALDASTGELSWLYRTSDDGPTAAVYQDGYVAFNTESCELEILTPDGKPLWKKWLGDPLMSMPAIADGRIYMAFPDSKGDRKHYLACFALDSGKEVWRHDIDGEIITAPVVSGGRVYLSTLAGLVYCFDAASGKLLWSSKRNATSSPSIWKGEAFYSQRQERVERKDGREVKQQEEQLVRASETTGTEADLPATRAPADYLDYGKRASTTREQANQSQDATVGFGGGKGDSKMEQAIGNLGEGSVYGVWSYQGSRPLFHDGQLFTAMGDTVKCVDPASGKVLWTKRLSPGEATDRTLTPPALANGKLFLGTSKGQLVVLDAASGKALWTVQLGDAVTFQPAVVGGRVYLPTASGTLYCVETGDPRDDGWPMWGGGAHHNG